MTHTQLYLRITEIDKNNDILSHHAKILLLEHGLSIVASTFKIVIKQLILNFYGDIKNRKKKHKIIFNK